MWTVYAKDGVVDFALVELDADGFVVALLKDGEIVAVCSSLV